MTGIVTIGQNEEGPHVDALLSLAERLGVLVERVPDGAAQPVKVRPAPPRPFRKLGYAGRSHHTKGGRE